MEVTSQNKECPCKRKKCERYGNCAACKEHHHNSVRKPLTACERLEAKKELKSKGK